MFSDDAGPRTIVLLPAKSLAGIKRCGEIVIANTQENFRGHALINLQITKLQIRHERGHFDMPARKPFFSKILPSGFEDNGDRNCVTCTNKRARQHVAWIMHAVVEARELHGQRHRQHEPETAPVIKKQHHRGGEPVGGVR